MNLTIEDVIKGDFKLRDYSELKDWVEEIKDKYQTICLFSLIYSNKLAVFQANGPDKFVDYFIFKPKNFDLFFRRKDLSELIINNSKLIHVFTNNDYNEPFLYDNDNIEMLVYGVFLKPKLASDQLKKYQLVIGKTQTKINWTFTPFNKKYCNYLYSIFPNINNAEVPNTTRYLDILEPNFDIVKKTNALIQKDIEKIKNLDIRSVECVISKKEISFRSIIWSDGLKHQLYRDDNPSFSEEVFEKIRNVLNDNKKYVKLYNYYFLSDFLLNNIDKIEVNSNKKTISIPIPKISEKTNVNFDYEMPNWYTVHTNSDEYDFMCFETLNFYDISKIIEEIKDAIPEDDPDRDSKLLLLELLEL